MLKIDSLREGQIAERRAQVESRNRVTYDEEAAKLDRWAEDLQFGLDRTIKELKKQIAEAKRTARGAATLQDKLDAQKQVRTLEAEQTRRRRDLFEAEDDIGRRRDAFIAEVERRLQARDTVQESFLVRWTLV